MLANFVGYQLVWFVAVFGAARGAAWAGVLAAALFVLWQLFASPWRALDARLVVFALLAGSVLDGWLAACGWVRYAGAWHATLAPPWILALWGAFALTLTHSLRWATGRPWLAGLLGAGGGPLAYAAAARLQAIALPPPAWRALLALAVGWAAALYGLATLARRGSRRAALT